MDDYPQKTILNLTFEVLLVTQESSQTTTQAWTAM